MGEDEPSIVVDVHSPASETEATVRAAFRATPHPGDEFLLGSEGREATETIAAFHGVSGWDELGAEALDANYTALSFFSAGGFRFFLPAYLTADLRGELLTADPVFHLAGGFHDLSVDVPIGDQVFSRPIGRSAFVNPRRYGAMTFEDYARHRLSVFSRQECAAIVAYLDFRGDQPDSVDAESIRAALELFWHDRAATAPEQSDLDRHLEAETAFLAAIDSNDPPAKSSP